MEVLSKIILFIYTYCTDFIINLANILQLSYYEVNALIFCVIWPLLTIFLIVVFIIQKIRYRKIVNQHP